MAVRAVTQKQPATSTASLLSAFQFSDAPPTVTAADKDVVAMRRDRFLAAIALQREILKADIAGTKFSKIVKKYIVERDAGGSALTNEDGSTKKKLVEQPQEKWRRWWFQTADKSYGLIPRYSVRKIELQKGKATIVCGNTLQSVDNVLASLVSATEAGELNAILKALKLGRNAE